MTISQPLYNRIAIIGGGPLGLAVAKALALETVKFDCVDVFERRDNIGGVWYHGGNKALTRPTIPSTSPVDEEIVSTEATVYDRFFSPIYEHMETNITSKIMEYNGIEFPSNVPKYPTREQVEYYIQKYATTIPDEVNIRLNADIQRVEKIGDTWVVQIEDTISHIIQEIKYDAIVVANGHFNVPYIPDVPGLKEWNAALPGSILYSKYYESPKQYRKKRVLVVGNSASGVDISTQLSAYAEVFVSVKDLDKIQLRNDLIKYIGLIEKYDHVNRSASINDEIITDIDVVIFCTGYLYTFPFLKSINLITDGFQVNNLYKQMFYIDDPSISFVALLRNVVPMPISESQGAAIARVYSGRLALPSKHDMKQDYYSELALKGSGLDFHNFAFPKDVNYCHHLQQIIDDNNLTQPGLLAPVWDDERTYHRLQTKVEKSKRLEKLVQHVQRLRETGEEFSLPDY